MNRSEGFVPSYMLLRAYHATRHARHLESLIDSAAVLRCGFDPAFLRYRVPSGKAERFVYTCRHSIRLPGYKARFEGDKVAGDRDLNQIYSEIGSVRQFLKQALDLNGIDDNGYDFIGSGHFSHNYNNAFFNMVQMVFGDGDGVVFAGFIDPVICGHEIYHGVVANGANLEYAGQSGAINESCADIGGVCHRQFKLKCKVDEDSWLVGERCFAPSIKARALRDMLKPGTAYDDLTIGKDPQPAHMRHFVKTELDNGGVHINSGILNRAFATFAVSIGGYVWDAALPIWHMAVYGTMQVEKKASFQTFANRTVAICDREYSKHTDKLVKAWKKVGITVK